MRTQGKEYTEFRADGWPLCPSCGEDELWSDYIPVNAPTTDADRHNYRACIVGCLNCGWKP